MFSTDLTLERCLSPKTKTNLIRFQDFYPNSCYLALRRNPARQMRLTLVEKVPESTLSNQLDCMRNFKAQAGDEACGKKPVVAQIPYKTSVSGRNDINSPRQRKNEYEQKTSQG